MRIQYSTLVSELVPSPLRGARPRRRTRERPKALNLALQGGGAHGAFTWGVLERLLEEQEIAITAVSGASAGAVNAVALAAGLMDAGNAGARAKLERVWRALNDSAESGPFRFHPFLSMTERLEWSAQYVMLDALVRRASPYQFNPFDVNPLRHLLTAHIDFEKLRRQSRVSLFVSATEVTTSKVRLFRTEELNVDVLLASTCQPQFNRAVKVGDAHYWGGGQTANPAILPLVQDATAEDTLIIQTNAAGEPEVPTNAQGIRDHLDRITLNAPLRHEIELVERCREIAGDGLGFGSRVRRRFRRHRFHLIEADATASQSRDSGKPNPDWVVLCDLRKAGREAADAWLADHVTSLGERSTVELGERFLA